MNNEIQLSGDRFAAGALGMIDAMLTQIDFDTTGTAWIDRIDRAGTPLLALGHVRVPVKVMLSSDADTADNPNEDPRGPATRTLDARLTLTPGAFSGATMSWLAELEGLPVGVPALSATLMSPAPVNSTLAGGFEVKFVHVRPSRIVLSHDDIADETHRIPVDSEWCQSTPETQLEIGMRRAVVDQGYKTQLYFREENRLPVYDFEVDTDVPMPDPLPALRCHVKGTIRLALAQTDNQTRVVATIKAKAEPIDDNTLGEVLRILPGSPFDVTIVIPTDIVLPVLSWIGLRGTIESMTFADSHLLLSGSVDTRTTPAIVPPEFVRKDWNGYVVVVVEGSTHIGGVKSASTSASVRLDNGGTFTRFIDMAPRDHGLVKVPKLTVSLSGNVVHVDATSEQIELREIMVGQAPYRLLVHSTRGHRLIDFGIPPHPERDENGNLTNASVIAVPPLAGMKPVVKPPISDPPWDESMKIEGPLKWRVGPESPVISLSPLQIKRLPGAHSPGDPG